MGRNSSKFERLRAQIWARNLALVAGITDPKKLEKDIAARVGLQRDEESNQLGRYFRGANAVEVKRQPGCRGKWVQHGEASYPGTAAWFDTPVWYLLDPRPLYAREVLECARLLPGRYRDLLLHSDEPGFSAGLVLQDLWAERIYELAARPSLWSLGALACALRRAEFAGQAAVFRLAAVGILWTSERLIASAHETVREPLIRFRQLAAEYFETQVVPLSVALYLGISAKDLARFSDGVNEFLRRDAAEDAELWKLFND
jgi:hypothetical protein